MAKQPEQSFGECDLKPIKVGSLSLSLALRARIFLLFYVIEGIV